MIRASLCLGIILVSMLVGSPSSQIGHAASISPNSSNAALPYHLDPNGTLAAFNSTLSEFDLYTNSSAKVSSSANGNLTWISTLTNTVNGSAIPGTGFIYSVPVNNTVVPPQSVNWTLTIPKGVGGTTYVRFDWNGTIGARASARYLLFNETFSTPFVRVIETNKTFTVGTPLNSTGGIPLSCGAGHECVDVSRFVGYKITLAFMFNSTSTGGGLLVRVANVEVASTSTSFTNAVSHFMQPLNSTEVSHNARMSVGYNSTVTYRNAANTSLTHTWQQLLATFFTPGSYLLDNITFNGGVLIPASHPFGQGICAAAPCAGANFVSINMTLTQVQSAVVLAKARSTNAIKELVPTVLGVPTVHFTPGDTMAVKMTSSPGVNVSASQEILLVDPTGLVFPGPAAASNRGGTYFYNVTVPLTGKPGPWLVNGTFTGGYDIGFSSKPFNVEAIQPAANSFSTVGGAGSNTPLNIHGSLNLISGSTGPAGNVNVTVFAVDSGASAGPVTSQGVTSSLGLYVKNITLVNGVFTVSQQLTMLFAVVNPTTQPVEPFNATVTIEHEWYASQTHGVQTVFKLTLGDQPFTTLPQSTAVYRADITINPLGIQLQVRSITSPASPPISPAMTTGSSPVTSTRQHFGKFRITIASTNQATSKTVFSSSESPTYAFTLDSDLTPSRLLASSTTLATASNGNFSTSISSDNLLGAKNLVLFALGRDANGIPLSGANIQKPQKTSFFSDSTVLVPSANIPSDVTTQQSVTLTLNLKSNSSSLPLTLTVNLYVSSSPGVASSQTVTVPSGSTKPVSFTFQAPSTAGSYLLTFVSPNYLSGVPLLTKTLQVSIISSNLQILIPALIGLIVALVILGYYAMKRGSRVKENEEEDKPTPSGKPRRPQSGPQTAKSLTRS